MIEVPSLIQAAIAAREQRGQRMFVPSMEQETERLLQLLAESPEHLLRLMIRNHLEAAYCQGKCDALLEAKNTIEDELRKRGINLADY